ncbi:MAG: type II toxin-antitoxin system RelE/ParE family toxin [Planctomycetota bacterium]
MPEYRLTPDAEDDLSDIARYTLETWGEAQQRLYEAALITCFEALADGSARTRRPLPHRTDVRQVHCRHHYVFAIDVPDAPVTIVAVLHEKMDLMTRLLDRLGDSTA